MVIIMRYLICGFVVAVGTLLSGCSSGKTAGALQTGTPDPCLLILVGSQDRESEDLEISELQQRARSNNSRTVDLEKLGWAFVKKARLSYDPGYYTLAEACSDCMESKGARAEALLLRGHALQNLHRFSEAETIALELVASRGLHIDYGLLGDALMEQGRLDRAVDAYQKMIDLKPGPQSYSRAAHIRWLKGDDVGALELARMGARSTGVNDREAAAWAHNRLAFHELQSGSIARALTACDSALSLLPDYAPALLTRGRILLALGKSADAIESLSRAAQANQSPEYQWMLAEGLRASGRIREATEVEEELARTGATTDARTFALYLATRGIEAERAVLLVEKELESRSDVFTLDAMAWALAASGRHAEAQSMITRALSEGTRDARLFLHAGVISRLNSDLSTARQWLDRARTLKQMLLPSEREELARGLTAHGA